MNRPRHAENLVLGAGPAGLAVGACLRMQGAPAVLLEAAENVGASWRRHYQRLHLHTARNQSTLPGMKYPPGTPRFPSREQVLDYLERYVHRFRLDVRFNRRAVRAWRADGRWHVDTDGGEHWTAGRLIVATGRNAVPTTPAWPGLDSYPGTVLHSREYWNGEPFRGQRVLVAGFGNSGGEIALDLAEHGARPTVSVRGPVNVVPREIFGIPALTLGIALSKLPARVADALAAPLLRLVRGNLNEYGIVAAGYGANWQLEAHQKVPVIDVGTLELIRRGAIAVRPGVDAVDGFEVVFRHGRRERFDALVLATGYRPAVASLLGDRHPALDGEGMPRCSGSSCGEPGLYFCGFRVPRTGVLREIGIEARRIAEDVAQRRD